MKNSHLPIDLPAWIKANPPDSDLTQKNKLYEQVSFVHNCLCSQLSSTYEEWEQNPPMVISTFECRNMTMPVYRINLEKYGIEIILMSNFRNWIISIKSDMPLNLDYIGFFNKEKSISPSDCRGLPSNKIYGSYSENQSEFTLSFSSMYDLYTFIFLLKNYLDVNHQST